VTPEPSRVQGRRARSSERARVPPSGGAAKPALRSRGRSVTQGCSCFERLVRSEATVLGRNRGPGAGGEPHESGRRPRGRRRADRSERPWSAARAVSLRRRVKSAGGQGPGSRVQDGRGGALKRRGKAQESIGPLAGSGRQAGTDPRRE